MARQVDILLGHGFGPVWPIARKNCAVVEYEIAFVEQRIDLGDILRGMAEGREVGCPSQKLNLGADNADFVPSRGRGRADSMAG